MKKFNIISTISFFLFWNCTTDSLTKTQTIFEYDTIQNGFINIQKTELIYNSINNKLIQRKFYRNNPTNDNLIKLLSGVTDKDSIILYSIDSIFYPEKEFDTITKNYKKSNNKWFKNYIESKKYTEFDSLNYLKIEFFEKKSKIEEFVKYNKSGKTLSITRYECNITKKGCDSIFKREFIYDKTGKLEYSFKLKWKDNEWKRSKCF